MEDQLVQVLANTHSRDEGPRKQAELDLKAAERNPAYASSLATVAAHASLSTDIRQSALAALRRYVDASWSVDPNEPPPPATIPDEDKSRIRLAVLELAVSDPDRKIKAAARYVPSFVPVESH